MTYHHNSLALRGKFTSLTSTEKNFSQKNTIHFWMIFLYVCSISSNKNVVGGQGWIRTIVLIWEQIYSLPPLATRPPTLILFALVCSIENIWCSLKDLNLGPTGYEPVALTNWAKGANPNAIFIIHNIFPHVNSLSHFFSISQPNMFLNFKERP